LAIDIYHVYNKNSKNRKQNKKDDGKMEKRHKQYIYIFSGGETSVFRKR
jgi:hypothetical protein